MRRAKLMVSDEVILERTLRRLENAIELLKQLDEFSILDPAKKFNASWIAKREIKTAFMYSHELLGRKRREKKKG